MKIYTTLLEAKNSKITSLPGIYYFRNKINNKYYIGQALNIKHRFKSHWFQIQKQNIKYPIYKATTKYGIENFEFGIIGVFKIKQSKELLKKKLDYLEIKYIKEYNSYGQYGYNQTKGGDGGILGYKMTEEQKQIISQNSKKLANDGRNTVYVYDLENKKQYTFTSCQSAANYFNINRDALYSSLRRNKGLCNKRFLIRRSLKELSDLIEYYKKYVDNSTKHTYLYSIEEYLKIRNNKSYSSAKELANILNVCVKTIYNYEKLLPEESRIFTNKNIQWNVLNITTNEIFTFNSIQEIAKFVNSNPEHMRNTINRCIRNNSIYKKTYKFSKHEI